MTQELSLDPNGEWVDTMYGLPAKKAKEGLMPLDVIAIKLNEEHRQVGTLLSSAVDHALRCGDLLLEAREHFSDVDIRTGKFGLWIDGNFAGGRNTAWKYQRIASNKGVLGISSKSDPIEIEGGINGALKMLSAPKDENPEPAVEDVDEADIVEDAEIDLESEDSEEPPDFNEELEQLRKEKLAAEKAKKDEEKKRKAEAKRRREAEKKLKEDSKELEVVQKTLRERFEQQLAEVHARYGIEETPGIFEVDDKHWEAALEKTRSRREEEALKILKDFFPTVSKMRKYEPDEAARACLKWPSEARSKEAIREIAEWMTEVSEEMDALTTKGILRAVKE